MRGLRVLVVDDSVVMRRVLAKALSGDPGIAFVDTAANGRIALAKIARCAPDVVTLDVEMPEMDGLKTLAALREMHPSLPVIMFSAFDGPQGPATLDAGLAFPVVDYVSKSPQGVASTASLRVIQEDLLPRIKMYIQQGAGAASSSAAPRAPAIGGAVLPVQELGRVEIVVVGVSMGGPHALAEFLPCFPKQFPVPILIVQHMPSAFMGLLVEQLAKRSSIGVAQCSSRHVLGPEQAWLAPGGSHMVVERAGAGAQIRTDHGPPENSCRPSVDVLFRSASAAFGPHVLAVMMTGMGQDGLEGCRSIRKAGGQILVQDEASSVVWGMPRFVAQAGLVDQVLPLSKLGPEIVRKVMESRNLCRHDGPMEAL
jgi:two-component system, chemotaxis family, protein-glutamate methylesterase/glutaminase